MWNIPRIFNPPLPTDLEILELIYRSYYNTFSNDNKKRITKNFVPLDILRLARTLKVDSDIIFSRLYYHLEKNHSYSNDDGSKVHFFLLYLR